jgi:hypothetical protein
VKAAAEKAAEGKRPVLVWICDEEDAKTNDSLQNTVFADEKVGLALKRFACFKAVIQSMPDAKAAEKMRPQTPIFHFYDPTGKEVDTLSGKRATSKSGFAGRVEKVWDLSYEMPLKVFAKQMGGILDRLDQVAGEKQRLEDQMARAAENPGKLAGLKKDQEALTAQEKAVEADQQKLIDSIVVRAAFRPGEEKACR